MCVRRLEWSAGLLCLCYTCAIVAAAPAGRSASAGGPPPVHITLSKQTTFAQGPVNADGTLNCLAAFNDLAGKGVSQSDNAAGGLILAAGPQLLPDGTMAEVIRVVDVPELRAKGDYFTPLSTLVGPGWPGQRMAKAITAGPWSPKAYPKAAQWLKVNAGPLAVVVEAVTRPRYFIPLVARPGRQSIADAIGPDLAVYRQMGSALVARSMLQLQAGKVDAAWDDALAASRLGRLIGQQPLLTYSMTGLGIDLAANKAIGVIIASGKLSAASNSAALLSRIKLLPPPADLRRAIDLGERLAQIAIVMRLAHLGPKAADEMTFLAAGPGEGRDITGQEWRWTRNMINWDVVLKSLNRRWDGLIDGMKGDTIGKQTGVIQAFDREYSRLHSTAMKAVAAVSPALAGQRRYFQAIVMRLLQDQSQDMDKLSAKITSGVSDLLLTSYRPPLLSAVRLADTAEATWDVNLVATAVEAFKHKTGQYPEKLSEIEGAYLKQIPSDPFAGRALRYWRSGGGYVLYSIGVNMRDDGGKYDSRRGRDDIVIRVK